MKVYWVNLKNPHAQIKEFECKIVTCKKTVWAEKPSGQRGLLGASTFLTVTSATRCQTALLQKFVSSTWIKFNKPQAWNYAKDLLAQRTLH